jgi:class 3 adenylate cyclase/TolB-like protein
MLCIATGQGGIRTVIMERKLAAILSADVQGYSRLMGEDEEVTILTLMAYREVMTDLIEEHRGRVVDTPGDNLLAEFASVVDATQCAVAIQEELQRRNAQLPANRNMAFRIGINLGDVVVDGERIYGEGVNLAARLEGLAEGGGICISGTVYDQVASRLDLQYVDLGEQRVKNIVTPVRAYRVCLDEQLVPWCRVPRPRIGAHIAPPTRWRPWSTPILASIVILTLLAGARFYRPGRNSSLFYPAVKTVNAMHNPASPPMPTIAIHPFTPLSSDPVQQSFSHGMTQTLITDLTKLVPHVVVVHTPPLAASASFGHGHLADRAPATRYALQGSVRIAEQRVRVTLQLVDMSTGYHLWADRYDHDLREVFILQDEITQRIVAAVSDVLASLAPDKAE